MTVEKAILGTFLKENHLLKDTVLKPEHFSEERNKRLFGEMKRFVQQDKGVDIVTLSTSENLEQLGGMTYISELEDFANAEKIDEYETILLEDWKDREKRNILTKAAFENWSIDRISSELDKINVAKVDDHKSIKDAIYAVAELPWTPNAERKGVSTGIRELDRMTNGFVDSELTVIGARPSMGKSDVMLHFAKQAGWLGRLPIIFSLEMPERSLTDRLIASTAGYNRIKMRNPYRDLTDAQKEKWTDTLARLAKTNIQIFDRSGQTVPEMRSKTRKLVHQFKDKKPIIFVDYLTIVKPLHHYNGNMHQQTTEIANGLKELAKEFDCPVVALAQLNRSVETRKEKQPMMADIRESGSVEQIADVIMFLYREKYYNKESDNDTLEIIVAKNRQGPIGSAYPRYNEHTGEIKDAHSQIAV